MLVITEQLCKGCGYCIDFCPKKVLEMADRRNSRGFFFPIPANEGCISCGICANMCPEAAIELKEAQNG